MISQLPWFSSALLIAAYAYLRGFTYLTQVVICSTHKSTMCFLELTSTNPFTFKASKVSNQFMILSSSDILWD